MRRSYYVYILASTTRVLYVGMTNDLSRRLVEHRTGVVAGFTRDYNVIHLVFVESFSDPTSAIAREKQLKGWRREKKIALIEAVNPAWRDLSVEILGKPEELLRHSGRGSRPSAVRCNAASKLP